MAFLIQRFLRSSLKLPRTIRAAQEFEQPDVVVLPVRDSFVPSGKPPVRIFLGTEDAQYKAERVFIWSIEKVRDPSRVYEIHLMKNLRGFRSRFWLTGFTNYRFAIPHFAGKTGRAIYNDVDQVYLKDPGELFDLELGEHGYLAITPGDTSVALFDCERMASIWTLDDARTVGKNPLHTKASSVPGLWGELDKSWNARDREYIRGQCGVLHYTALHRQPWQPFPQLFVYQANNAADIWFKLEQSANDAGFQVFSALAPSQGFKNLKRAAQDLQSNSTQTGRSNKAAAGSYGTEAAELLEECDAHSVLDCHLTAVSAHSPLQFRDAALAFDPTTSFADAFEPRSVDAVVCHDLLEFVPDDDIPWLLESLFSRAGRLLFCHVDQSPGNQNTNSGTALRRRTRTIEWWQYQLELVARFHPSVRWCLSVQRKNKVRYKLEGNECDADKAVVWVLQNRKPGHNSQAIALAQLLGSPYQAITVPQGLKSLLLVMLRCNFGKVDPLSAPWPNVIVASGWWPTRVARWVKMRSSRPMRLLLTGRKCGPVKDSTDVLVSCEHFNLPINERRILTVLPANTITESTLDNARVRGQHLMGDGAQPRVALLLGGSSKQHILTPADAVALGHEVFEQVQAAEGSLFAVTSRRTGSEAADALAGSLQGKAQVHLWSHDELDNPYMSYLAAADILVVSGESESMLIDAIATDKPVYIYPLKQRRYGPWLSLGAKLESWSRSAPKNRRGTERPQQGFEYFCSRVLEKEWILPPRDIEGLHRRLVEQGYAQMFGTSLSTTIPVRAPVSDDLGYQLRSKLARHPNHTDADRQGLHFHNVTMQG